MDDKTTPNAFHWQTEKGKKEWNWERKNCENVKLKWNVENDNETKNKKKKRRRSV